MPEIKESIETFYQETRKALQALLIELAADTSLSVREWNTIMPKLTHLQSDLEKIDSEHLLQKQ